MTDIKLDPTYGTIRTEVSIGANDSVLIRDAAIYKIVTKITDGQPLPATAIHDTYGDFTGGTATARLRDLAAALIEHADAVDLFRSTYREAEYEVPAPKPVEVFPGFPLTMTTEADTELAWPIGVTARDREGDVWGYTSNGWRSAAIDGRPVVDGAFRIPAYLPASIIPTSWPKAADTTPEN